jgi:hypothetical protein
MSKSGHGLGGPAELQFAGEVNSDIVDEQVTPLFPFL